VNHPARLASQAMNLKDLHVLRNIRKGNIKSFEALFHEHYRGMVLFAVKYVKNEAVAEELVQDIFYNIWKNRQNFRLKSGWARYLYGAVHNNSLNHLRKNAREVRKAEGQWIQSSGQDNDLHDYMDLEENVEKVLENLPEKTREIFRLSRFEGKTYREIAETLAISIKTVEANMGKALKVFRTTFQKLGYIDHEK